MTPCHDARVVGPYRDSNPLRLTILAATSEDYTTAPQHLQYSTVQYSTVQYSTVQYSTVQYSTVQYSAVQCSTVQYSTVQYNTIQYRESGTQGIQYNTIQYNTMQCNTIQYRVSKRIVPHLCGCCGGAVYSIISVFTQLHRLGFNLDFETLYESI